MGRLEGVWTSVIEINSVEEHNDGASRSNIRLSKYALDESVVQCNCGRGERVQTKSW